jgi:hypothetical protein
LESLIEFNILSAAVNAINISSPCKTRQLYAKHGIESLFNHHSNNNLAGMLDKAQIKKEKFGRKNTNGLKSGFLA